MIVPLDAIYLLTEIGRKSGAVFMAVSYEYPLTRTFDMVIWLC